MMFLLALLALPPLLVFGVYHLALWVNLLGMTRRVFWRRVAIASALSHILLGVAFLVFLYLDYRASVAIMPTESSFEVFLYNRAGFWRALLVFDTLPALVLVGALGIAAEMGWTLVPHIGLTSSIVLAAGTLQWYWVGAGLGALGERLWSGLKTPDDDLPDWM